jgi:hypothetical protein
LLVSLILHLIKTDALSVFNRRKAVIASFVGSGATLSPLLSFAEEAVIGYERRDRRGNRDALIREDYWYMMGKAPPRKLQEGMFQPDDPQWNAFGTCESSGATNSCTYVPLKQRIPAYSKYGFSIALGSKEFAKLGKAIDAADWELARSFVEQESKFPPPVVDALLKMVLFASAVLTTPNYSGPNRELLVARYYANEVGFATKEIGLAIDAQDLERANGAWSYGRDSWNSYFTLVNRQITPKVGDRFELV